MIKLSDYLDTPPMGEVVAERNKAEKAAFKRQYAGARVDRLNSGWTTNPSSSNYELRTSLRTLRARARAAARDNSHFKKFLTMTRSNIVGPKGIQLQVRAALSDNSLNAPLNKQIENAFWEWGFKENCSASGKLSWFDAQNLFVTQLARDGEVLVQKIFSSDNPFGFSLKFIDVSYLDETYNEELNNGNRVLMSVEVDKNDRPIAYYLTTPAAEYMFAGRDRKIRVRVPAEEMIHAFMVIDDETQTRGVTWFHTALEDAKNLAGYKQGVITSARAAACAYGMLIEEEPEDPEYVDTDEDGNEKSFQIDVKPLSMNIVPKGYKFEQFDPKQPTQNHPAFYQSILMDLAVGLDVPYFALAGDMKAVNYSSARTGLSEARDIWKVCQEFVITHFCRPVYQEWARSAWLSGKIKMAAKDFKQIQNPMWRGRGWAYINPSDEIKANTEALAGNMTTLTDICAEQGIDIVEHFETIKHERELAKQYGIDLTIQTKPAGNPSQNNDQNDVAGDPPAGDDQE